MISRELWIQQSNQPFLFEVPVSCERFGFAAFAHHDKTNGIAEWSMFYPYERIADRVLVDGGLH